MKIEPVGSIKGDQLSGWSQDGGLTLEYSQLRLIMYRLLFIQYLNTHTNKTSVQEVIGANVLTSDKSGMPTWEHSLHREYV